MSKKDVMPQNKKEASKTAPNPGYATKEAAKPFVARAWHVQSTDVQADANVEWRRKTVDVMGQKVAIPYLTNPKVIQSGAYLKFYRRAEEPAPSQGASKKARKA